MADVVDVLRRKLSKRKIKVETVMQLCFESDENGDQIIHIDDLKAVLGRLLEEECPSRRELHALEGLLRVGGRGDIDFTRLQELLSTDQPRGHQVRWEGDAVPDNKQVRLEAGSLGEWLQRASCPLEVQNYQALIAALETFERDSGMKVQATREGLTVPLGPDLRASISFFIQ